MSTVISWAMTGRRDIMYMLIDHVLVALDASRDGDIAAVAQAFDSVAEAHERAVQHTEADEAAGYRLDGPMRVSETVYNPDTIAMAYATHRLVGLQMLQLMEAARDGKVLT